MLLNYKKYFIHKFNNLSQQFDDVVAQCNEYNIEKEKSKLPEGDYMIIGPSCQYKFRRN